MDEKLSVGAVIGDTFRILRGRWAVLVPLAILLLGLPQALPWMAGRLSSDDPGTAGATTAASGVLTYAFNVVFSGAATHAALAALDGGASSFLGSLGRGFRMVFGVFAVSVRSGLGILIASLLLVVPGVMLFCSWAVVLPAYVAEGRVMGRAFARSRELTRGHRWRILGLSLVFGVVVVALALPSLLVALFSATEVGTTTEAGLMNAALDASSLLAQVGYVALYAALRRMLDGAPTEVLAAAFE